MKYTDMLVLVTGANGFIGRNLCTHLETFKTPARQALRQVDQSDHASCVVASGAIDGKTDWSFALDGISEVVHLAAMHHVKDEQDGDVRAKFKNVNVDGTLNLAVQAVEAGVKRFIYLSSIKVNGEETFGNPFRSSDKPNPLDLYGKSKLDAENGLREIEQEFGLEVVIIRPPLVYGNEAAGNFLRLKKIVKKGIPLPFGSIDNQRSLVAVDNLCDLIRICLKHPGCLGKPLLVSDGEDVSTAQLISLLANYSQKSERLISVPQWMLSLAGKVTGKSQEIRRLTSSLQVDIDDTKKRLGWTPPITLEEGIRRSVG